MSSTDWLSEALIARGLSRRTVKSYRNAILRTLRWCEHHGVRLDDLAPHLLAQYVAEKPNTWATKHLIHCSQ